MQPKCLHSLHTQSLLEILSIRIFALYSEIEMSLGEGDIHKDIVISVGHEHLQVY